MKQVRIEISGPTHSNKTNLMEMLSRFLEECGAEVVKQKADKQIDRKERLTTDDLKALVAGTKVIITEMNT